MADGHQLALLLHHGGVGDQLGRALASGRRRQPIGRGFGTVGGRRQVVQPLVGDSDFLALDAQSEGG
ncbi:MAG: hypothetical protein EON87_00880 [Brevundimonas sp.]|nr:MAG: hypothetical protein EON87_00880 [Brevundimonas sp.]